MKISFSVLVVLAAIGCGSSSSPDGGTTDGGTTDAGSTDGGAVATTTIAAARAANVTTPITVQAVVMAESGVPNDYPTWYIEDPAGGAQSGVAVYCDPDLTCPKSIAAPALGSLVLVTGSLSTYKGQLQLVPTAQTVMGTTTPPAAETVTMADVAEGANSKYRGVYVSLDVTKLTVDSVAPTVLWDTECTSTVATDGGSDGEPVAAGMLRECGSLCEPPAYSGFQVNDGMSNEAYIEAPFFYYDHLQSSPECLTQTGVIPVLVGTTFSKMSGILDVDPYGGVQEISPIQDSSYTTP